jgi:hypothetical protein
MSISAGIVIRRFGAWLTTEQRHNAVESKPMQTTTAGAPGAGWGALDEWEAQQAQRARKAGMELMKFQGVNRGY